MPPEPMIDLALIDANNVAVSREEIYRVNPHRHEFQQLDGIFFMDYDRGLMAGYRDVRDDEFWVRGHIPSRPLMPGVLIIEAAAQLVSYYMQSDERYAKGDFLGFGGVDGVKFRGVVEPGDRLIILGKMIEVRPRRCLGATQGLVNGQMVYEGMITGMWL